MTSQPQASSQRNVDDQRQIIYAASLRFNLEAEGLRQKVLDRLVLSALLESTEENPYKVEKIQKNLKKRPQAPELREIHVRETLGRLSNEGKVKRFEQKSTKTYCLTQKGEQEIQAVLGQAVDIFDSVLPQMAQHTESLVSFESATDVCRAFIMECFAKLGREIARSVMGRLDKRELAKSSEVDLAFEAAVQGRKLTAEARQSLHQRCVRFIRSEELHDETLKRHLTQMFFLSELLCLESSSFDPFSTQAFRGAVFYLDTNVMLEGLLPKRSETGSFEEMLRIASRLGIELRITRATINEARRVIANKQADLEKYRTNILGTLSAEVTALTHDSFLSAYQCLEADDSGMTPARFFERFGRLTELLEQDWGVKIDDVTEDEILGQTTLDRESAVIQEETMHSRRLAKSDQVLRHDLALLALVRKERTKNRKTWLLTFDGSLIRAASQFTTKPAPPAKAKAAAAAATAGVSRQVQSNDFNATADDELPFCFSFVGFLQCISPFTTTLKEENSVADIFSTLVTDYLPLSETLFDMREMNLLMECHEDVMRMPADDVVYALDYVNSHVLQGRPYTVETLPKVALELKKYFSQNTEERQQALEQEVQRQAEQVKTERRAREELEKALEEERRKLEEQETAHAKELQEAELATIKRQWSDRMIMGLLVGAAFWFLQDVLVASVISKGLNPAVWADPIRALVVVLAAASVLIPAVFFLRSVPWRGESTSVVLSLFIIAILASSRLLKDDTALARVSSWIQVAVWLAQIIYLIVTRTRPQTDH